MPVPYFTTGGQGHRYQVPDYPETADGPKAFKDFADYLDLILPPVGTIMPFVGDAAPSGWLLCRGQEVSSAQGTGFPRLAALCGIKFGTATQPGHFKVPDLRGRAVFGFDGSQTEFDRIGKAEGAKTITLTASNLPAHTHNVPAHNHTISGPTFTGIADGTHTHGVGTLTVQSGGAHTHTYTDDVGTVLATYDRTGGGNGRTAEVTTQNKTTTNVGSAHDHALAGSTAPDGQGHIHSLNLNLVTVGGGATVTAQNTGGGTPVTAISPYLTLNHIIRAA